METAVSYARVSSVEQRERGLSIEAQVRFIRKYASDHGLKIIREFIEVETAKVTGRPRFNEMVEYLESSSDCRLILVEKTDRLYRNLRDMILLDDLGIDIHFTKEGAIVGPQARSSDKFMHGIRVLMAKNYVDNLSEEVKKGMMEKILKGGWPHPAPFGYVNTEGPESVEPEPLESIIVKWLFNRFIEGDISVSKLHSEYKREWENTRISKSYIHGVLRNPFYTGTMRWKSDLYPGKYEPIIDRPTWELVQILLDASMKSYNRSRSRQFTFRKMIKCGHCGCWITAEIKKERYAYYHCTGKRGACKNNGYLRQEFLEVRFLEEIRKLKIDSDKYQAMLLQIKANREKEVLERQHEEGILKDKIRSLQKDLEGYYRLNKAGRQSMRALEDKHEEIMLELSTAIENLKEIQLPRQSEYTEYERLLDLSYRAEKLYENGKMDIRRKVVDMLFEDIKLVNGELQVKRREKPANVI